MGLEDTVDKKIGFIKIYYEMGCNIRQTCRKIGIGRSTFYKWQTEDADFHESLRNIEEELIDYVESALLNEVRNRNITAMIFFLKCKAKHRGYIDTVVKDPELLMEADIKTITQQAKQLLIETGEKPGV